jgi:hypothetical protein
VGGVATSGQASDASGRDSRGKSIMSDTVCPAAWNQFVNASCRRYLRLRNSAGDKSGISWSSFPVLIGRRVNVKSKQNLKDATHWRSLTCSTSMCTYPFTARPSVAINSLVPLFSVFLTVPITPRKGPLCTLTSKCTYGSTVPRGISGEEEDATGGGGGMKSAK